LAITIAGFLTTKFITLSAAVTVTIGAHITITTLRIFASHARIVVALVAIVTFFPGT
jgi:hypothetical protein